MTTTDEIIYRVVCVDIVWGTHARLYDHDAAPHEPVRFIWPLSAFARLDFVPVVGTVFDVTFRCTVDRQWNDGAGRILYAEPVGVANVL